MDWRFSYLIGRDPKADAPIAHASVSRRHSKLALDEEGRLHLFDLGSKGGTFLHRGGAWRPVSHDIVTTDEPVMFGTYRTTLARVLESIERRGASVSTAASQRGGNWQREATVVHADVVAYSRMMSDDPEGTLRSYKACRRDLVDPAVLLQGGRLFGEAGDSFCAEFRNALDAVRCANAIQLGMQARRSGGGAALAFRIGIDAGEVIADEGGLFGNAVNIAARLQALAPADAIWLSERVRGRLGASVQSRCADRGEQALKNIPEPVRVYEIAPSADLFRGADPVHGAGRAAVKA
jgi:class 3 adenylate cyclase